MFAPDHFDVFPTNLSAPVVAARIDSITEGEGSEATDSILLDEDWHGFHIVTDSELAEMDASVDEVPEGDWDLFLEMAYVDPVERLDEWDNDDVRAYRNLLSVWSHEAD
jgi:hypothetical protein